MKAHRTIEFWNQHRKDTEAALAGRHYEFRLNYGYLPKCLHGKFKNGKKD